MLIAYCFNPKDEQLALKNAQWMSSLSYSEQHRFFLGHDSRCNPTTISEALAKKFAIVGTVSIKDQFNKWPQSPNLMFATMAREISYRFKEPWLWLEPDCIPVKDNWLDILEATYKRSKKPFMGGFVPRFHDSPDHMTGNAIYPPDLVPYAGEILISTDLPVPFDLIAAQAIAKQAMFTDLIQHVWSPPQNPQPPFKSLEDVKSRMTSECVLYHADKTGTLIDVLESDKQTFPVPVLTEPDKVITPKRTGEARESTENDRTELLPTDSRGGENTLPVSLENKQPRLQDKQENAVLTIQDHVRALREYAEQSWNAKGRVVRQLKKAGLASKK